MTENEPVIDDAVGAAGRPVRRRGSRRVVMLSEVDAKRIASGEYGSAEEVLHATDQGSPSAKPSGYNKPGASQLSPHDRAILNEVPPHFGKI
ncbi:hypothetical protein [Trueperella pecoris]|uniref:Uncharacterized protein n=1 Tax=Trueperella pecoris TaxID=2733571 RepID=A0A7M1QU18_9ACTO|nr:hypothetical protein [Trueperella pecoris]QOQ38100.1 hypothetical protein HLG82_00645 [Trueperella pecoris]QOR45408.1 hypothetical protein INS88_09135 [Trueperella pecoris]QTG75293.1 hypothetical protein J4179_08790 [Trueperella pecoris]